MDYTLRTLLRELAEQHRILSMLTERSPATAADKYNIEITKGRIKELEEGIKTLQAQTT